MPPCFVTDNVSDSTLGHPVFYSHGSLDMPTCTKLPDVSNVVRCKFLEDANSCFGGRNVLPAMLGSRHQNQIIGAIISLLPVSMVDNFTCEQNSSKGALHYEPMFKYSPAIGKAKKNIALPRKKATPLSIQSTDTRLGCNRTLKRAKLVRHVRPWFLANTELRSTPLASKVYSPDSAPPTIENIAAFHGASFPNVICRIPSLELATANFANKVCTHSYRTI